MILCQLSLCLKRVVSWKMRTLLGKCLIEREMVELCHNHYKPDFPTEATDNVHQEGGSENVEVLGLSKDTEDQSTESGTDNAVIDHSSGSNVIEIMPVSPHTEVEPILDEEASYITFDNTVEEDTSIQLFTIKNNQPISISEAEMIPDNVQSSDQYVASGLELRELESPEVPVDGSDRWRGRILHLWPKLVRDSQWGWPMGT